jgi:hypothetical protein
VNTAILKVELAEEKPKYFGSTPAAFAGRSVGGKVRNKIRKPTT